MKTSHHYLESDKRRVDFKKPNQEAWFIISPLLQIAYGCVKGIITALQLKPDSVSSPVNALLNTHFEVIMMVPMSEEILCGYSNYR